MSSLVDVLIDLCAESTLYTILDSTMTAMNTRKVCFALQLVLALFPTAMMANAPDYIKERDAAISFLQVKGVDLSRCELKCKCYTPCVVAFGDNYNDLLVITVTEDYWKFIDNPVLAYSIESSYFENGGDTDINDGTIADIMNNYHRQITQLSKQKRKYKTKKIAEYKTSHSAVAPLLKDIAFSQYSPYNLRHPKVRAGGRDTSCLIGCGPTALAQVLRYYSWPPVAEGYGCYSVGGETYKMDLSKNPIEWENIKPTYARGERDSKQVFAVNNLMLCAGASLNAKMNYKSTSSSLTSFEGALLCNWRYSPSAVLYENITDDIALPVVFSELDSGRPVVFSDDSHIFVCDGYDEDFLHYNLGWNKYGNGYYRVLIVDGERGLPFVSMLAGIAPLYDKDIKSKKVKLQQSGSLARHLSSKDKETVTELIVKGPLNGEDMALIRKMAGADTKTPGSLMKLDLREADIVRDESFCYYSASAKGYTFSGTSSQVVNGRVMNRSYNFDMSNLTPAEWQQMVEMGLDKYENEQELRRFVCADGEYMVCQYTQDDAIGDYMFAECGNLREVILPESATSIGRYVFFGCRALQRIVVFDNVDIIEDNAFSWTPLLHSVTIPTGFSVHKLGKDLFSHSSPLCREFVNDE